jgi:cathepsin X
VPGKDPTAGCKRLTEYQRLVVTEHGRVSGRADIKAEIFARGPVSCEIDATEGLDSYMGGHVYEEYNPQPQHNHLVSIVGWGVEDEDEYWIVRNSWGDAWGERGFFRIPTSAAHGGRGNEYNLGIEESCGWAVPGGWKSARELGFDPDAEDDDEHEVSFT